ncbi:MAG: metalloregulator ArsR/SmtB family transcription factor [Candidatus Tritonobacter lacicola]|nr:metalloregulator ArsR/SmtB family transcription factor [Candidatus Tritonobacter lacicola]
MRHKTALFKSLSNETRLRVLILLSRRELCVCEIEEALELSQSRISRHLTVLRNAGLVVDRREGTWIYYRLAPPRDDLEGALQKCLITCFSGIPMVQEDLGRLDRVLSVGRGKICARKRAAKKR